MTPILSLFRLQPYSGASLQGVCVVMTLKFERLMDRVGPVLFLSVGLAPFGAMALLGV